jgi:hypothetical protein
MSRVEDSKELFVKDQVGQDVIGVEQWTVGAGKVQCVVYSIEYLAETRGALDNLNDKSGRGGRRLERHKELERLWPACVADDDRVALHDGVRAEKRRQKGSVESIVWLSVGREKRRRREAAVIEAQRWLRCACEVSEEAKEKTEAVDCLGAERRDPN